MALIRGYAPRQSARQAGRLLLHHISKVAGRTTNSRSGLYGPIQDTLLIIPEDSNGQSTILKWSARQDSHLRKHAPKACGQLLSHGLKWVQVTIRYVIPTV